MSAQVVQDDPLPAVRRLTLNRPEELNALSRSLVAELMSMLAAVERCEDVNVVILRGAGSSFCAGADLSEHFVAGEDEEPDIGRSGLWEQLETLRVPVIAAVHGWAVTGGFLLAYSCDLIVASTDAVFRDTHAALGLLPTGGESQRLMRRVGAGAARDLLLTSRALDAEEAATLGLVNRVVAPAELEAASLTLAEQIAANSPRSVTALKRLLTLGSRSDFGAGLSMEQFVNNFGRANYDDYSDRTRRLARFQPKDGA